MNINEIWLDDIGGGVFELDLALGRNNVRQRIHKPVGEPWRFWRVTLIEVVDPPASAGEDYLAIVSGLDEQLRLPIREFFGGPVPVQFTQPGLQNFSVSWHCRPAPLSGDKSSQRNEGLVRMWWTEVHGAVVRKLFPES